MKIDILTTFVEMFQGPFDESIIKRAQESGRVAIELHNLRDWTHDVHHKTDDEQYGGGKGMVMMAEPLIEAIEDLCSRTHETTRLLFPSPQGRKFEQSLAEELSEAAHLLLVCGHYKGIDQRVLDFFQPEEISIGDYVLTGGELPAMVIVDAVARLVPGVVGGIASVEEDSFTCGLLDCPRYTRPREVKGLVVPDVLLSGNHAEIEKWRTRQSEEKTARLRPDIFKAHQTKLNQE